MNYRNRIFDLKKLKNLTQHAKNATQPTTNGCFPMVDLL